jgi:hypothetical protein
MSHFTVLVIGDDAEAELQPFHEFECTGTNDEYVIDEDVTEELQSRIDDGESIEDALGYYGLEDKIVDHESKVDTVGDDCEHKYGYAIVKDGALVKAVNRTNPNRKWDWYQVGGRWSGMLRLKPGAQGAHGDRSWMNRDQPTDANYCDSALKKDIDFATMRDEAGNEAAKRWDEAHAIISGRTWLTWEQVQEKITEGQGEKNVWDVRREFYHDQEALKALRQQFNNPFANLDEFLTPREAYVNTARNAAGTTFAVLKDGEWYEKGDMGWWGMVSDEKGQDAWNEQFAKLIDDLPDDTRLTVVDCHI